MATHQSFFVGLLLVTVWSLLCSANVFRADSRSPDVIRKDGGFKTRGQTTVGVKTQDISLWNHVKGAENGFSKMNDGYVSTTTDIALADSWVRKNFRGTGWIYRIKAAPNMIDCQATLGEYNPFPNEKEYAAIGGIKYEQIIGWIPMTGGVKKTEVKNGKYNSARYGKLKGAGAQPSLAAFPDGHAAWNQSPWNAFGTCSKPKTPAARDIVQRQSCKPSQTNAQYADQYITRMNSQCGGTC